MFTRAVTARALAMFAIGIPCAARAQDDTLAHVRRFAGCYALSLGPWSGPLPDGSSTAAYAPPSLFRLDTLPVGTHPQRFAVAPAELILGRVAASWALLPYDVIDMFWSTGFIGVRLRLSARADSLVGTAVTFHDAHRSGEPPDPQASVIATRTSCPPT